jgi:anion-transporting  ArsA/GET3 family ATPase
LGRLFGANFGPEPVALGLAGAGLPLAAEDGAALDLHGAVLDARAGQRQFLESVVPVAAFVRAAMTSRALRRLLDAAPSLEEMGVFYHFLTFLQATDGAGRPRYDQLIVDMPATGHALALTSLPDALLRLLPTGPVADVLREGQRHLYDPSTTGACVVTLPEALPVTESLELLVGLRETRVPVAAVVVNKWVDDPFTDEERARVERVVAAAGASGMYLGADRFLHLGEARAQLERLVGTAQAPVVQVPEIPSEGATLLDALARTLNVAASGGRPADPRRGS